MRSLSLLFVLLLTSFFIGRSQNPDDPAGNAHPESVVFTNSNLPIVILNTNNVTIPNEPKIPATMKIIYNGPNQTTWVTDPPNIYNGNIGIERRGAFSNSLPQKPYNLETRDAQGKEMNVSLLGMPAESDWLLIANYNDKAFVRNTLAYKLFTEMGHYAARSRYCEVVLNGSYQGIYLLMEKIKRDDNRVDIAKLDHDDNAGDSLTGGYIIKSDYWDNSNSWLSNYHPIDHTNLDVHFVYYYRSPDSITSAQKAYIKSYFNSLEGSLYSSNYTDTVNGYRKYISITSFLDYFIVNELSRNTDGFKKSIFYHKDKDPSPTVKAKLKAGPVWDFDWAWKNIQDCYIFQATNGSGWSHKINDCSPDVNSTGWYVRLMQDPRFRDNLKCRWTNLRQTILDTAYLFHYIDSTALVLDSAQQRHYQKWGHLGQNSGAPEIGPIPTTFVGEVNALKSWIRKRIVWLDANMPGTLNGCSMAGIGDLPETFHILIYPNPARDKVYFEGDFSGSGRMEVVDAFGKIVYRSEDIPRELDVTSWSRGLYFLRIIGPDGRIGIGKLAIM